MGRGGHDSNLEVLDWSMMSVFGMFNLRCGYGYHDHVLYLLCCYVGWPFTYYFRDIVFYNAMI